MQFFSVVNKLYVINVIFVLYEACLLFYFVKLNIFVLNKIKMNNKR